MKNYGRLPFQFDVEKLRQELEWCKTVWIRHFNTRYYSGEWSGISLRSPKGGNHALSAGNSGAEFFEDEAVLKDLTYTRSVLESIKAPKSAVRYLRLTPGSVIRPHKDYDLVFWDGAVRLHIPVITNDKVQFLVNEEALNMLPGECWFADFSKTHSVANHGMTDRIHLVVDCQVTEWLKEQFIVAGILSENEQPPREMDLYDNATKRLIIEQLEAQGTEKARELAERMRQKEVGNREQ